jgi:preprotein translocase subunit YajC
LEKIWYNLLVRKRGKTMREIYDLIKDINKKTVTLASGEKGKISRIMRLDSGEVLVELKAPNGEISLEGFYPLLLV